MVTTAASINHRVLDNDASKAAAAPCRRSSTLAGMAMSWRAASMAAMDAPSEPPGGRLNEKLTAGNWDRWFTASGTARSLTVASAASGIGWPSAVFKWMRSSASGLAARRGSTSSTTRYWFDCVNRVATWRWPKAL